MYLHFKEDYKISDDKPRTFTKLRSNFEVNRNKLFQKPTQKIQQIKILNYINSPAGIVWYNSLMTVIILNGKNLVALHFNALKIKTIQFK